MGETKTPHPFDVLKQPMPQQAHSSFMNMSDEEWKKRLQVHDDALEAASRPRTTRQKLRDFFFGLLSATFFVGFGLFMGMPELRHIIWQLFDRIF